MSINANPATNATKLKVISFNIRTSHGSDGINNWKNRKELVIKSLMEQNADVIGMQEVTSEQYLYLKDNLKNYQSYAVGRQDGKLEDEIMAIFYKDKFDVLVDSTIWLSETPTVIASQSWDAALYRTVSWVQLMDRNSKVEFMLFNTHFDHRGEIARAKSAKLINQLITDNAQSLQVVLTGDFNITTNEEPYQILTSTWKNQYQLIDSRKISIEDHEGGEITYNGYQDNTGKVIDYIFVSPGIKVLNHKYLDIREGNIFISDHYPVEALIEISDTKVKPNKKGKILD